MLLTVRVLSEQGPVRVELARWEDRLVVVKRLLGTHPVASQRLEREAAVVGRLRHENIVPLLGISGDASLIYAYCPGVSLEAALERGPLRPRRAMKIARDVLSALAYAHAEGVLHLDVKPANILVKGETALLTDFGFAKDLGLTAITTQDMLLGTPSFMAPEQFKGVRTDHRSDLYATGAVIYHMLTGAPPFGGQVVRWLAGDDRVPLDPLPESVAQYEPIVAKALARDPDERYSCAEEFLAALEDVALAAT
ncbi:MAG: serine/threonine protein kinase [Trueperaceae bacterium]|nr:serine/threonine protein kinase [Trueperaceae bacterium]MCO5173879.1 serine/threonine protein kinase [Trueperaceae bacterium]MCW5819542.1 serine/threonine protein kinase [Trueperaceae bacterium]